MRVLKLLIPVAILGFTMFLTSCQHLAFLGGSKETDQFLLKRDVARMFPPILVSEGDALTYGTLCQIVEQNVTIFCEFPEAAPQGFPTALCSPGVQVCREVLGDPSPPSTPPPSRPSI